MTTPNLLNNLFIFEMANNHQGSFQHGRAIISEMGRIARRHNLNAAVKFQYRDLDSFIHADYKTANEPKHISRFMETRLSRDDYRALIDYTRNEGLTTVVTPFDEISVDHCLEDGVDILKVASCSANDWPLLERIAEARRPTIVSTGGLNVTEIDSVVSFFIHKRIQLGVLHCVGIYPMPPQDANLNFMEKLSNRYPSVPVGWSGHEAPTDLTTVVVAVAKGAQILERHVGLPTESIKLNAYSMSPAQTEQWVEAALESKAICGGETKRITQSELDSLRSLKRGVYAARKIKAGELIDRAEVIFQMPCQNDQLTSGEFGRYRVQYIASRDYDAGDPIKEEPRYDDLSALRSIIHDVKGMLYESKIALGDDVQIELSHHYGFKQFRRTGAVIVNVINRNYCKKLIILLPGQNHPVHWHEKKEETFQILAGEMEVYRNGENLTLKAGGKMLIEPGTRHSFRTQYGVIFEEVSTTHFRNDSFYEDEQIQKQDPLARKTILTDW